MRFKTRRNLSLASIASLLLILGCGAKEPNTSSTVKPSSPVVSKLTAKPATEELPNWSNTEAELATLGESIKVLQYEIRPPSGFRSINIKQSDNHHRLLWAGPIREDETYAQLIVIITATVPMEQMYGSLELALQDNLNGIKQQRTTWVQTPIEHGTINGIPFVRTKWSGKVTDEARKSLAGKIMHGIVYTAMQNNRAISIMCQDVEPEHENSLKRGQAVALSFRPV